MINNGTDGQKIDDNLLIRNCYRWFLFLKLIKAKIVWPKTSSSTVEVGRRQVGRNNWDTAKAVAWTRWNGRMTGRTMIDDDDNDNDDDDDDDKKSANL